jgi:hypothetical protein
LRRIVPSGDRGSRFQPLRAAFDSTAIDQDVLQLPLGNDRVDVRARQREWDPPRAREFGDQVFLGATVLDEIQT